jgi:hypothetical protein
MNDIKKAAVYIAVVFFIGLLLGWLLYAKCNPLPVIRPSKPDTTLAITKPPADTSHPRPIIVLKVEKDTVLVDSSKHNLDSSTCWEFSDTTKSKAIISAEICSKELPKKSPLDLSTFFRLQLPPDTLRTVKVVDTVMYRTPFFKDGKNYAIATLLGLLTYDLAHRHGR